MWVRLEDIAFVGTGSTPDRSNSGYYGGTIPWVNSSLTQNDFICDTPECITEKAIEETSCRIYPIGTLIVAMYGQGKTRGQVSELKIVAATNQACAAINVYESNINSYVKLFFKYNYTTIRKEAAGGAQPNLNLIKIKKIPIPLPPLSEQQRIVAKIEELMPLVEEYDKAQTGLDALNAKLSEVLKKSILQEAIQGRLVAQDASDEPASVILQRIKEEKLRLVKEGKLKKKDVIDSTIFRGDDNKYFEKRGKEISCIDDEIPFEIPDSWEWVRFGSLINMRIGKTPPRGDVNFWSNGTTPWISISDMSDYGIIKHTKEQVSDFAIKTAFASSIVPAGTLIMSFKLTVGRTSILDIDAVHNEAIISIKPYVDSDDSLRDYLFYILPLISNFGDSKDAIKGKTLNSTSLFNLLIPLPPLVEQRRIVNAIIRAWQVL